MAELNETQPAPATVAVGPGARLKAGREAQGQSLAQAARHLRLDEPTLAAIEADEYPAHVPATFLRGYLRAYAKWLELPSDDIVAAFNTQQPDEAQLAGLKSLLPLPQSESGRAGKWLWWSLALVMLVALVAGAVIMVPGDWLSRLRSTEESTTETAPVVDTVQMTGSSGELALQLAPEEPLPLATEPDATTDTTATAGMTNAGSTAVNSTAPNAAMRTEPARIEPVSPAVASVVSTSTESTLPGVSEALELSFMEDCWIRVTDAAGNVLSVGIKQKGQRIRLSGSAPLTAVLGNPPGVQLKHNGRPVDLSSYPGSRPATLTLQQQAND